MNNQEKLIDADKLLEWMSKQYIGFTEKFEEQLKAKISIGDFEPDTPPVPTIKPGDKVTHIERGIGAVLWVLSDHASVQFNDVIKICKIRDLEVVE